MSKTSGLTVRQHEREGIEVPVEFAVCDEHGVQVRFSATSAALNSQTIRGEAMDISSGGMGLRCRQCVPRMTEGVVRVFAPARGGPSGDAPVGEVLFEEKVKVKRVTLIGREPTYSLGVAFTEPTPALDDKITDLFRRFEAPQPDSKVGGASHA